MQIRRGAVVRAMKNAKGDWMLTQLPEVEGALVAMDPRSGAIRALVGGFDFGKNKFNHATQAWRQPGSAFKPFIYSAALEKGFTPGTVVNDAPLFFDAADTGSQPWEPKNYDGKFEGPMPLQTALAKSKNMVSIRVLQATGVDVRAGLAAALRLRGRQAPGLPADGAGRRLGDADADGHAPTASSPTAATGVPPVLIERVTDNKGRVLLQRKPPGWTTPRCARCRRATPSS